MTSEPTSWKRSCFVIAPPELDLSRFKETLISKQIEYRSLDRWRDLGPTLPSLKNIMKESEFICVFIGTSPSPNLMFEAGMAMALGKPTFVVASPGASLAFDLLDTNVIRSDGWNSSILEPHLNAFLNTLPQKPKRIIREKRRKKSVEFKRFREQVHSIDESFHLQGRKLESFVAELFRQAGFDVSMSPVRDRGADMAVWSLGIKHQFGNPLLVEVKDHVTLDNARAAAASLSRLIREGRGSVAFLISLRPVDPESSVLFVGQPIVALSVGELIEVLEHGELVEKAKAVRNDILGQRA